MDELTRQKRTIFDWIVSEMQAGEQSPIPGLEQLSPEELEAAKDEVLGEPMPEPVQALVRLVAFVERGEREAAAAYLHRTGAPAAAQTLRNGYHR